MAKRKRASSKFLERRRKKANLNSTSVLFQTPSSPSKAPQHPKPEVKEEPSVAETAPEPSSHPKKSSRLGSNFQVGPMPTPNGPTNFSDDSAVAECTVTWNPSEFNAKWGDYKGEIDPIQKFLSTVPSKFQDIAMSAFHESKYEFAAGKGEGGARRASAPSVFCVDS